LALWMKWCGDTDKDSIDRRDAIARRKSGVHTTCLTRDRAIQLVSVAKLRFLTQRREARQETLVRPLRSLRLCVKRFRVSQQDLAGPLLSFQKVRLSTPRISDKHVSPSWKACQRTLFILH